MLLNAKSMLDAAHKLEGFGMKDVENALLKLTGAQDAVELYKLVMGCLLYTSRPAASKTPSARSSVKIAAQSSLPPCRRNRRHRHRTRL